MTNENQLVRAVFTEDRVAAFFASGTRYLIKRRALGGLHIVATWIGDFSRTLGTFVDTALLAWCSRDQDGLVIEVEIQRTYGDATLCQQEVEVALTISIKGRHGSKRKVASYRWIGGSLLGSE